MKIINKLKKWHIYLMLCLSTTGMISIIYLLGKLIIWLSTHIQITVIGN